MFLSIPTELAKVLTVVISHLSVLKALQALYKPFQVLCKHFQSMKKKRPQVIQVFSKSIKASAQEGRKIEWKRLKYFKQEL